MQNTSGDNGTIVPCPLGVARVAAMTICGYAMLRRVR